MEGEIAGEGLPSSGKILCPFEYLLKKDEPMSDKVLPPLSQADPVKAWQPWEPTAADPWNLKWAGHLYRRAGFGGNPTELHEAVTKGWPATLDGFLKPDPAELTVWENLVKANGYVMAKSTFDLRAWWVYNILWSEFPLTE